MSTRKDLVQLRNPRVDRYVKIDRAEGNILSVKRSPGLYKGIPIGGEEGRKGGRGKLIVCSPSTGEALTTPYGYKPRHCFIMTQLGSPIPEIANAKSVKVTAFSLMQYSGYNSCLFNSIHPDRSSLMNQITFADAEHASSNYKTRREIFLEQMNSLIPWSRIEALIEPHYPKAGDGHSPYGLPVMLRIHCLQLFYSLSDSAMEDELYLVPLLRRFAGISRDGPFPDESRILNFRLLLEKHGLDKRVLAEINRHLAVQGLILKEGTIAEATIVAAPTSTKFKEGKRVPEMTFFNNLTGTMADCIKAVMSKDNQNSKDYMVVCKECGFRIRAVLNNKAIESLRKNVFNIRCHSCKQVTIFLYQPIIKSSSIPNADINEEYDCIDDLSGTFDYLYETDNWRGNEHPSDQYTEKFEDFDEGFQNDDWEPTDWEQNYISGPDDKE